MIHFLWGSVWDISSPATLRRHSPPESGDKIRGLISPHILKSTADRAVAVSSQLASGSRTDTCQFFPAEPLHLSYPGGFTLVEVSQN